MSHRRQLSLGIRFGLWLFICTGLIGVSAAAERHLEVVIVSVENFDDQSKYHNATLEANIESSTDALIGFFRERFPFAILTVLRKANETTTPRLGEFFRGEFPKIADGNITLLFVLSHGEALNFPNPSFGADLGIVTTDTTPDKIPVKAISLSKEVLGSLDGLSPGSFIFGFIDTCHSGAAANIGLSLNDALRNSLGVRAMFMASSLSDQLMYKASFTKALVNLWRRVPKAGQPASCTAPEASPASIRSRIAEILKPQSLGENEGYPRVLLPFNGQMCLETFSAESAIVGLINGTADSYAVVFTNEKKQTVRQPVDRFQQIPVRLNREPYVMRVYRDNHIVDTKHLDLRASPLDWEPLGAPTIQQLAQGFESTAHAGYLVDVPSSAQTAAWQLSYAAYAADNDSASAGRVASLAGTADCGAPCSAILAEASRKTDPTEWLNGPDNSTDLRGKAFVVQSYGQLAASAPILEAAAARAKKENSPSEKQETATQAYFAYLLGGDFANATRLKADYKLDVAKQCAECDRVSALAERTGQPRYRSKLGNLAAARLLESMPTGSEMGKALISRDPNEHLKKIIPKP